MTKPIFSVVSFVPSFNDLLKCGLADNFGYYSIVQFCAIKKLHLSGRIPY